MIRLARFTCWLAVAVMAALAAAAIVHAWQGLAHHPAAVKPIVWRIVFALLFLPAWLAIGIIWVERLLKPKGMQVSDGYLRLSSVGMAAASVFVMALQGWLGVILVFHNWFVLQVGPQQATMLIGGAFVVIFGNASAKLAPPTGPTAPEPGRWIRTNLRAGWLMVLSGLSLMAAAFAPPLARGIASLALSSVAILAAFAQIRANRAPPDNASTA